MKNIAIIPARGGSKRIPHKNIKDFCGKPIIAYSIEIAKASQIFDKIIVSTDDLEIAEIAKKYGAEVPFVRDKNIADDVTGVDAVIVNAVLELEKSGFNFDFVTCIYPTSPFLKVEFLKQAYDTLLANKCDLTYSVAKTNRSIFRDKKINDDGFMEFIWLENAQKRSQDFFDTYYDAAQFYMINVETLKKEKSVIVAKRCLPTILPSYLVHDIDTKEDWIRAEKIYKALFLDN